MILRQKAFNFFFFFYLKHNTGKALTVYFEMKKIKKIMAEAKSKDTEKNKNKHSLVLRGEGIKKMQQNH